MSARQMNESEVNEPSWVDLVYYWTGFVYVVKVKVFRLNKNTKKKVDQQTVFMKCQYFYCFTKQLIIEHKKVSININFD